MNKSPYLSLIYPTACSVSAWWIDPGLITNPRQAPVIERQMQVEFNFPGYCMGAENKLIINYKLCTYIFEVKWKTKAAGYSDIRKFLDKVRRSEFARQDPELFMLSRSGLTEQARNFAVKNKIHVLNPALRDEI